MRTRILIGALIALGACAGGEAKACFWIEMPQVGGKPSEAELLAREKKASADQLRQGTRKAKRDLAAGVDAAAALADWTVPDVRPVPLAPRYAGRMTAFQGLSRRLPLLWMGSSRLQTLQVRAWHRRLPAGRALKGVADEFWAETGPLMADPKRLCPAATANWPADQTALVGRIESLDSERRAAAAKAWPAS